MYPSLLSPRQVTMAKTPVSWAEVKTKDPTFLAMRTAEQRRTPKKLSQQDLGWFLQFEQKPTDAREATPCLFQQFQINRTRMNKVLQVAQHFPAPDVAVSCQHHLALGVLDLLRYIETWDMDEDLLEMLADVATKLY